MVYVLYRHDENLRHVSPQNRFTLKEFERTTRDIGLIFRSDPCSVLQFTHDVINQYILNEQVVRHEFLR